MRHVTDPKMSAAATALNNISKGETWREPRQTAASGSKQKDKGVQGKDGVVEQSEPARKLSYPDPPLPEVTTVPSAPDIRPVPDQQASSSLPANTGFSVEHKAQLTLYTYTPSSMPHTSIQPSPLPSKHSFAKHITSLVNFNYASLPWRIRPGDYLEIRRTDEEVTRESVKGIKGSDGDQTKAGGEALKGVSRKFKRDGYIFRVGEDAPNLSIGQIQVPESVAAAFKFQHRLEVDIHYVRPFKLVVLSEFRLTGQIPDELKHTCDIDYIELRFSQYLGRADMWRLGMSLENSTVHVGEKVSLAGGVIKADVQGLWRGSNALHRHASGIVTSKTKTIYRSKSAQFYIFIQLCQETWEFDEDGERYSEKIVHGELFTPLKLRKS